MANKSIVVYGGTLAGVAAAAKAAGHVDLDKTDITLIVPDPVNTTAIDASESGRLTRLSNFGGTTGRYDWACGKAGRR